MGVSSNWSVTAALQAANVGSSPTIPTKPKEPGLPLRVLGERCRRLERKPRVRPLVSRRDEVGHSGIRGRMKPQIMLSKDSLLLFEEEGRARRRLILQLLHLMILVKRINNWNHRD